MEEGITGRRRLDQQLQNFRDIAEERRTRRLSRWLHQFPFLVSFALFVSQIFNTGTLFSYSRDFTRLHDLLASYMNDTESVSRLSDREGGFYVQAGIHAEHFDVVREYMEQLWTLFVSEVIELIMPLFNIIVFLWIFCTKKNLPIKVLMIYIMVPVLALLLSISQACMIQVSLADQVHHVRFILGKVISPLLEHNPDGRVPIEQAFNCQFRDDVQLKVPSCASILHDGVMSSTTLNVLIFLHVAPLILFLCLLLRNLAEREAEHIFLYVENCDQACVVESNQSIKTIPRSLKHPARPKSMSLSDISSRKS